MTSPRTSSSSWPAAPRALAAALVTVLVTALVATLAVATAPPASAAATVTFVDNGLVRIVHVLGDASDDRVVVSCSGSALVVNGTSYPDWCHYIDLLTVDGGGGRNTVDLSGISIDESPYVSSSVDNAITFTGSRSWDNVRLPAATGSASGGDGSDTIKGGGVVDGGPGDDQLDGGRMLDGGPGSDQLMPDPSRGVSARSGEIQIVESVHKASRVWHHGAVPAYIRDRVLTSITLRPSRATLVGPHRFRHVIRLAAVEGWSASFQTRVARDRRMDARGMTGPGIGFGGAGRDTIIGGRGPDVLTGFRTWSVSDTGRGKASGADVLRGGRGNDVLRGGRGNDVLVGGPGADTLDCGAGHDVAVAGPGDRLIGCEVVR